MSRFGIGINTQDKDAGKISGRQVEVACECWFTKSGRTMPRLIKFQDEQGQIHTINNIRINYLEEKNYSGIPSIEYDCTFVFQERQYPMKLIFFKHTCRWVMKFMSF